MNEQIKKIVWLCPECYRTISCPDPSSYTPNTICTCQYPNQVTQMIQVWPTAPVTERAETVDPAPTGERAETETANQNERAANPPTALKE